MTLLETETGETKSGLTTTAVLLGQIHGELVQNFSGVTLECPKERSVTVHDNEAEFVVVREECVERLSVKLKQEEFPKSLSLER